MYKFCRNKHRSLNQDSVYYRCSSKGKALDTGFQADSNAPASSSRRLNHNDER